jgi:hypothetical protein
MPESATNSIETEDQGWPAAVTARKPPVAARKPLLTLPECKRRRTILIAAIGCLIGSMFWGELPLRVLAAFLGGLYVGASQLARWLPGARAKVSQVFHEWCLRLYRRRWLQFRLREMFVLVLVCGVALTGWNWISPYREARREQDPFIAAIEALGGTVTSSRYGPSWYAVRFGHSVSFSGRPLRDKDVAYLSTFPAAKSVFVCDMSSSLVTDAGLAHLAKWSQIGALRLDGCRITDEGISDFARVKMDGLISLHVVDCPGITDGSVDDLLKLAPDVLEIHGTSITPSGAARLEEHVWPRLPRIYMPLTSPMRGPGTNSNARTPTPSGRSSNSCKPHSLVDWRAHPLTASKPWPAMQGYRPTTPSPLNTSHKCMP